ncbi:MAG: cytochrome C oxidase subunit IV family protein [Magnetovibrio sp.]|nr:cytochrome C oxidase subunit IV family protein [Magnetovibrio sp.]
MKLPSTRTLYFVWAILMASTIGLMGAGRVDVNIDLGPAWVTVLLVLAGVKSSLILWFYLNLGQSSPGWKKGFIGFLCAILVFVWGVSFVST